MKRIKELYPNVDLEELLAEFNYEQVNLVPDNLTKKKKLKKNEEEETQKPNMIKQLVGITLGIEFEEFQRVVYEGDLSQLEDYQKKIQVYYNKIEEEERQRERVE